MKKLAIIGGTSGFGKWLAEFVLQRRARDIQVVITGIEIEKGKEVAQQLGCVFTTDNVSAVNDADIVIISVPIDKTEQTIRELGKYVKSGAILADVTSVKVGPAQAMYDSVNKDVLVMPTHPVFGPFVKKINGQVVVLTPSDEDKQDPRYAWLNNVLREEGFKVVETTTEQHDHFMSVIQGLTSYTLFVMGETLKKLNVDMDIARQFTSPIYKIMMGLIGRYMHQNPGLYADIQIANSINLLVHEKFIQSAEEFHEIVKVKSKKFFVQKVEEIKSYIGADAKSGQNYTDKLIYLYATQLDKLSHSIGKEITLENIYTRENIQDRLLGYDEKKIRLQNNDSLDMDEWVII